MSYKTAKLRPGAAWRPTTTPQEYFALAKQLHVRRGRYNLDSPTANIYGFEPCPKCGNVCRCAFNDKPGVIQCDGCGFEEEFEWPK